MTTPPHGVLMLFVNFANVSIKLREEFVQATKASDKMSWRKGAAFSWAVTEHRSSLRP